MANLILEYEGKDLFRKYKIPLSEYLLVKSAEEAKNAAEKLGYPVAVKAQVLSGGRGKRGLIKIAKNAEEVIAHSIEILSKESDGRQITHLLVEKGAKIKQEVFISMVFDTHTLERLILFSGKGGVDIEQLAEEEPGAIKRFKIPYGKTSYGFDFYSDLAQSGFEGNIKIQIGNIIATLSNMMVREDLQLGEINPLVITEDNQVIALDARVMIDGNAMFRHPERESLLSEELRYTPSEKDAKEHGLSYVNLGGSIGMLSVGAGLGMATADLLQHFGGSPLNFLDVGGGASQERVENALRIMIADSGLKAILINAFGGITRLDDIARGIVESIKKFDISIPIIIRLMGTRYQEGIEIIKQAGYEAFDQMEPAIEAAVKAARGH